MSENHSLTMEMMAAFTPMHTPIRCKGIAHFCHGMAWVTYRRDSLQTMFEQRMRRLGRAPTPMVSSPHLEDRALVHKCCGHFLCADFVLILSPVSSLGRELELNESVDGIGRCTYRRKIFIAAVSKEVSLQMKGVKVGIYRICSSSSSSNSTGSMDSSLLRSSNWFAIQVKLHV